MPIEITHLSLDDLLPRKPITSEYELIERPWPYKPEREQGVPAHLLLRPYSLMDTVYNSWAQMQNYESKVECAECRGNGRIISIGDRIVSCPRCVGRGEIVYVIPKMTLNELLLFNLHQRVNQ
jgi:hypothetical protein